MTPVYLLPFRLLAEKTEGEVNKIRFQGGDIELVEFLERTKGGKVDYLQIQPVFIARMVCHKSDRVARYTIKKEL